MVNVSFIPLTENAFVIGQILAHAQNTGLVSHWMARERTQLGFVWHPFGTFIVQIKMAVLVDSTVTVY